MRRLLLALATLFILVLPATASAAYDPLGAACSSSSSAQTSPACDQGSTVPITGSNGVLMRITLIISFIAGVAAVVVIIVSGMRMVFSGGDAKKVADARSALIGAIIGLVIIAGAQGIIIFVVRNL